ncbi:phosphate starvation protein PhoH [Porphyromonas macacae]|uniref:Phosphate starvation protein PhoH n=1 Tax=Porphyromonas macacae TaxID=28115 RepID=A0A0A2E7I0_9PORP|nr:PhoH family protein [Porphyromonas macacae]KGN73370.1 phosphate starvation protein PhoH [Porphyromonas macacae]
MGSVKKNFILDTNVILHDHECIEKFQENDIYIPITVLEELDKFKKGTEQVNYNARAFIRKLDNLTNEDFFAKGVSIGDEGGRLFIYTHNVIHKKVQDAFPSAIPDHRILSAAFNIHDEQPSEKTILVTKDVNLRMKARSLGMLVEDYINDKVTEVDIFNTGQEVFEGVDADLIDKIYASPNGIDADEWEHAKELDSNQCFMLKSERNSVMVRYVPKEHVIRQVKKLTLMGITPRNAEQAFAFDMLTDPDIKLVGVTGKAGTGKTLLALASVLAQAESYQQVLLARPIVSLANKDIGYLPGNEQAKVSPYMQPLFDNLNVIKSQLGKDSNALTKINELQKSGKLAIEALAFIRGRSLANTIAIIDEAQNLTPHEIKTVITRAGEDTKMIFTGDIQQIDSPYLDMQSNGLAYMIDRMKGEEIFAHVNLIKGERSELSELASNKL